MFNFNKIYWEKIYSKKRQSRQPSSFARFIYKKFIKSKKNKKLIDIGCGNARDSFFFCKKKITVTSIDRSRKAIINNIAYAKKFNYNNIIFKQLDINKNSILKNEKYDFIYLRFFIHTIPFSSQKRLFKLISRISKKNITLTIVEFRTVKDPMIDLGKTISNNETINTHYRRFIESKKFIGDFKRSMKCKLIYKREGRGLSVFGKDNPHLCRLVFKKK
tara:strand:+ start:1104 stop:1757 length:654 start_codon:yes stop_codon:yes gene_type:complete